VGAKTAITWDQFLAAGEEGQRWECVEGEMQFMSPVNFNHEGAPGRSHRLPVRILPDASGLDLVRFQLRLHHGLGQLANAGCVSGSKGSVPCRPAARQS
jgi:hypothetical protein